VTEPDAQTDAAACERAGDQGTRGSGRFWISRRLGGFWLGGRPRGRVGLVAAFVWLLFILFPLIDAVETRAPALRHWLAIAGAALFVAVYIALVLIWRSSRTYRRPWVLFAVLLADAPVLTLAERPGWGFLFTYCAACAAMIAPAPFGVFAVVLCVALAGGASALAGAAGSAVVSFVATSAGIGLLMLVMRDLRDRNEELSQARAELARLAVTEERERFARDLHDLLGHSLSVIALKAELAKRLLPDRAADARDEVADLERVARGALSDVREAVSGYRQPTLDKELEGARMALSAAGIRAEVVHAPAALDPPVEGVLAWAVREGATNVIRHSGAHHCQLTISSSLVDAAVEVVDDGVGVAAARSNGHAGHGLEGLAERARLLNGRIEAGARPEGGYRLVVTLPLARH
jgi:two-component system, NarL family, sensor histidine kinase DesK